MPHLQSTLFPALFAGIDRVAGTAGYATLLVQAPTDSGGQKALITRLDARQVDGLILATASRRDEVVARVRSREIPLVLINLRTDDGTILSVTSDDVGGIGLAVDHLVARGHRAIAHIAGPQLLSAATPGTTAIVAGSDLLAFGAYLALRKRNISCPDDISITGYNNVPLSDPVAPGLTTVGVRHDELGREAGQMLLGTIDGDRGVRSVVLPTELLIRASTATARTRA